jgi:hypothetical protein
VLLAIVWFFSRPDDPASTSVCIARLQRPVKGGDVLERWTPRFMRRVEAATRRHIENCSSVSRIFYDIAPSKVVRFDHLHYGVEVDYA